MSKKESKSLQPRPGRTTRKGICPNPTAKQRGIIVRKYSGDRKTAEVFPAKEGKNKLPPAKGFNPQTKQWDTQSHGLVTYPKIKK